MSKIITSEIIETSELEAQIKSLETEFPEQAKRGIAVMKEFESGCPLFLGINPSFLYDKQKGTWPSTPGDSEYNPYYPPIEVKKRDAMNTEETKGNRHFQRAIEISNDLKCKYVYHLDLLTIRETEEEVIKKLISSKSEICVSYCKAQICNATKIIGAVNPCLIIVENGLVREMFFKHHIFDFFPATKDNVQGWNEELGVDFIKIGDSFVPVIFTGMLASLNSGSYHSLKWHIRHILKNKDKWPKIETK